MTDNIDWDAHLDGPDAPWNQDEDLFDCTCCKRELDAGEKSRHDSETFEAPVCWYCARQIEAAEEFDAATTWTPEKPSRTGWYWVRDGERRLMIYARVKLGRMTVLCQHDGGNFYPLQLPGAEFWPVRVEAPGMDECLVTEAENTEARR